MPRPIYRAECLAVGFFLVCLSYTTSGTAQSGAQSPDASRRAVLLATSGTPSTALDTVVQASLEQLDVVKIVAVPGMDLPAVQLALDCVGETANCLGQVAASSHAEVLISPSLQHTPSEMVLSLLRFDTTDGGRLSRVIRRRAGDSVDGPLLDSVPGMLRELFGLPNVETPREPEAPAPELATEPAIEEDRAGVPVAPIFVAGIGVAAIGVGIAMGAVMKDQQDEYERLSERAGTKSQADAALDARSSAETAETASNVLFAVGGAAIVAGGIWLIAELGSRGTPEPTARLVPMIGPQHAGLVWTQRGDAL